MATNTKISDKPPIAPKSQALKLLAEEKRKMRPLQKRYVNSMKLRFEGISKSTGNVNYVSETILTYKINTQLRGVYRATYGESKNQHFDDF